MNLFPLARKTREAARFHCNRHVVKMALEYCQLLSTAKSVADNGGKPLDPAILGVSKTYRPTHVNHSCVVAVRRSRSAFEFLGRLAIATCERYTEIYGKTHASEGLIRAIVASGLENPTGEPFGESTVVGTITDEVGAVVELPLCMPAECVLTDGSGQPDVVASYRLYYLLEKRGFAKWPEGCIPDWWIRGLAAKRSFLPTARLYGAQKRVAPTRGRPLAGKLMG